MLLLVIAFIVFSTCTVLLEYYAVQYFYRLRQARQRKKTNNDDSKTINETPAKSASAPALMETPTSSDAGEGIPRAIVCPSVTPISNGGDPDDDVVSNQTVRKKETLPLPDGSVQTIVHIRTRAVLRDGNVKETVTVKVLEEDGSVEKEMEQTTSNVFRPMEETRRLDNELFDKDHVRDYNTPVKKLYSSPSRNAPHGLLQPRLYPANMRSATKHSYPTKQLTKQRSIIQDPQILLPKNKYSEPRVAIDGENAVVTCKQSVHFFAHRDGRWCEETTVYMRHVYCTMSVAISGNTAVVGVPKDSSGSVATGAVYIYEKKDDNWVEVSKFVPPFDSRSDNFRGGNIGYSVDIDKNMIVIGAPSKDSISRRGKVFVLKRCQMQCLSDGWVQHSELEAPLTSCSDRSKDVLGSVVSISNNMIIASGGKETLVVRYNSVLDSFIPMKASFDDANRSKPFSSLAVTNDEGILVGSQSDADSGAMYYDKNHSGPSSGQYTLRQVLDTEDEKIDTNAKKPKNCKCQVAICRNSQTLIMSNTCENRPANSHVKIYKQFNGYWHNIAVINGHSNVGSIFGNSIAISKNQVMIASSNNVYAYNLEI